MFNDKKRPLFKENNQSLTHLKDKDDNCSDIEIDEVPIQNVKKANCIKRLVSKNKRRYEDEYYDLDMAYITDRVIAMGFPSSGCETLYRNSISDVIQFFHQYHHDKVKIYNLCLENDRIYPKSQFQRGEVGLFPALDHNPCPIKLILEFCIDICLYLIKNREGIAAVHCKAGKGRTGVMICSYLIFSNICSSSEKAFRYYARIRTKDNTGVTIPSQRRYIKYFETFLESNFCPPYIFLIPKIIKYHFSSQIDKQGRPHVTNILQSFEKDNSYFVSPNEFLLKGIRVGPMSLNKNLSVKICHFVNKNLNSNGRALTEIKQENNINSCNSKLLPNESMYEIIFDPPLKIHSDIKISISGGVNFYVWVNLWYSSWEKIKAFYETNHPMAIQEEEEKKNYFNNRSPSRKSFQFPDTLLKDKDNNHTDNKDDNSSQNHFGLASINKELKEAEINLMSNEEESIQHPYLKDLLNNDDNHPKSLYEIIFKLKHNTNLNQLISTLNEISESKLDGQNLVITLSPSELDKFSEKKKESNCNLSIFYSLNQ